MFCVDCRSGRTNDESRDASAPRLSLCNVERANPAAARSFQGRRRLVAGTSRTTLLGRVQVGPSAFADGTIYEDSIPKGRDAEVAQKPMLTLNLPFPRLMPPPW
jgi:hypothetical protein